jgi:hypothetical protein
MPRTIIGQIEKSKEKKKKKHEQEEDAHSDRQYRRKAYVCKHNKENHGRRMYKKKKKTWIIQRRNKKDAMERVRHAVWSAQATYLLSTVFFFWLCECTTWSRKMSQTVSTPKQEIPNDRFEC